MTDDSHAKNIVKKYDHWTVYVHEDQSFLGRLVIWCNRSDAEDLADALTEEQQELFEVLKEMRNALAEVFGATWFNYSFLGNVDRHLHCHLIPRYDKPVQFAGTEFIDTGYSQNPYKINMNAVTDSGIRETVRAKLVEVL